MITKTKLSPNYSKKIRKNKDIKVIVLHYTGMQSKIESIKRLTNPKSKVSCHYVIDRKGIIIKLVDENKIAWHAGKSKWKNFNNLNKNSIGIELINKGHKFGYQKYSKTQITKLIELCKKLKKKYKISNANFVGHSDIAPMRKEDPGEKFPWEQLSKKKIGFWYKSSKLRSNLLKENKRKLFFKNLFLIGYRYFSLNKVSKKDVLITKAFKRRFLQKHVNGTIDQKTLQISHYLAHKYKN
tara:strand:- start:165 stop:884 length:720 start_codon:yes stop_codon:yes gene_type:complete